MALFTMITLAGVGLGGWLAALGDAPAQMRAFTARDMQSMDRLNDPRVSPDGKWVVFAVRSTDWDANRGRSDLWLAAVDGSSVRQLTTHEANDVAAQWLPDGKALVFLSSRSGSMQLWHLRLDGGEPTQLSRFPVDVENALVFPDGKRFLLSMDVYPDLPPEGALEATVQRDAERGKRKVKARVYDGLLYRHWDTWEDGKRSHLFAWTPGSAPKDLMKGMEVDCPVRPFGGSESLAISPDGKEVAFSTDAGGKDAAWSTDTNILLVPSDGSSAPRAVTSTNKASDGTPTYSPDGKYLAWLAMKQPGYESDLQHIMLMDRKSGATKELAEGLDRSPSDITWSKDGKTLWLTADHLGHHAIFAVDVATGKSGTLLEKAFNASPQQAGNRLVFVQDSLSAPADLFSVSVKGGDVRRITSFNADRLKGVHMGAFEQFSFKGARDETVYGWMVKPAGFREAQKYPVAFIVHGGPQGSLSNHFHYRWNMQAFAGAGYVTVGIDFHGSTGYGQAFTDAIRADWGGAPYEDLMKGLDAALARYPFMDGKRVCALGASYGGFMVNWLAGQTDRFKCLVNHDGSFDLRVHYYETEELWFPEWEFKGTPWANPDGYFKHNPIEHVAKWKTPMLVIHGSNDFRIPDTQGMSTFTALQRRGVPSRFVVFPEENHWVLKPENSVFWYDNVIGWLDQWAKPAPKSGTPGVSK
jgi:dipeptidyl aminopeptidase/acylaminoacyl peptidase